jgi:hypothetical protein
MNSFSPRILKAIQGLTRPLGLTNSKLMAEEILYASDSDGDAAASIVEPPPAPSSRRRTKQISVSQLVRRSCFCKGKCFEQFRKQEDEIEGVRKKFKGLDSTEKAGSSGRS